MPETQGRTRVGVAGASFFGICSLCLGRCCLCSLAIVPFHTQTFWGLQEQVGSNARGMIELVENTQKRSSNLFFKREITAALGGG